MRVLITTDWYEPVINGVVTSVMNLSRQLRERGHEVKILTLSRTFHSYIEGDVVYAGSIGLGCIYPQARLKIPKAAGDYMEMLLEWKPDIVHSQCEFSTFFLAKRIASELHVPIVHTYHTVYEDYTHYFSPQKVWGRNIVQLMTKKLANAVETLIVVFAEILDALAILEGSSVIRTTSAASIAENFVFAPISLAFADSASSSPPVAPEIADTFAIPCSNCIPVSTISLPKSTACLTPTNAPTATAAFDASDVSMLPALVDCEPKPFIPLVEPPRLLFKLLLALIADLILVKKLPFFNERVAPILFANIIYPPKSALYLSSSSSKAFSILALKKTFSVADALAILSQSNPFWT